MYLVIFMALAYTMIVVTNNGGGTTFKATKIDMKVVDHDKSDLSKELIAYLKKHHKVEVVNSSKSKLQEILYYQMADMVVQIPKGFEKGVANGTKKLEYTQRPGEYDASFLSQQVGTLMSSVANYQKAGYTTKEAFAKVRSHKAAKVDMMDLNGNGGVAPKYSYFLIFLPYFYIPALCTIIATILIVFKKKDIRRRMMASSVPLMRQTFEGACSMVAIGLVVFAASILLGNALDSSFLSAPNLGYIALNAFLLLMNTLAMAFVIGILVKKVTAVSIIVTPLSLGISFLCGVFVPLAMLSKTIKDIAQFIPVYWYEKTIDIVCNYANLTKSLKQDVWTYLGIQLVFAVAIMGVGLAITRYQQQER